MKKRIVYIPDYYYLSNRIFINLLKYTKGHFYNIYFNTKDPLFEKTNLMGIKKNEIIPFFDEYSEVEKSKIHIGKIKKRKLNNYVEWKKVNNYIHDQLSKLNPQAIITTTDMGGVINRMCNYWAKKNNVPYIVIQSAFIPTHFEKTSLKNKLNYLIFNKVLGIPLHKRQNLFGNEISTNHLILWSDYFKKYYKGTEIEGNIRTCGFPGYDHLFNRDINTHIKNITLPKNKHIVTICIQPLKSILSSKNQDEINEILISGITNNTDFFFLINVHPRMQLEEIRAIFKRIKTNNYIIIEYPEIFTLIANSDIQVSVSSTVSFESVILDIPIILIKKELVSHFDPFNNEIELRANTSEEFSEQLNRCIKSDYKNDFKKRRDKYLKKMVKYIDGKSSERIIHFVDELI